MPSNDQPTIVVLLFIFIAMILPGIVLWIDEYLWVDQVEKEERESGKRLTPSH